MGFETRDRGQYFNIVGGRFAIRVSAETPGAVARINKENKTVHEIYHDSFSGKLVGIKVADSNYGKQWVFSFQDEGDVYNLQLPYSNSYSKNLLKMLPNIDLTKKIKVQPSSKVEDGKTKSSLFISQEGNNVKHAYTKDNPNGLPQMEQIVVKGVPTWDDTKQIEFLHAMVLKDIVPKLPKATVNNNEASNASGLELKDEWANETESTEEEPF